jgi:chemotaxis protein CheC
MEELRQLKALERDAFQEIANIGAGNAATAVSQLIGQPLQINVPRVSMIRVEQLPEPLGGPEAVVAGIYFRLFGEAPGKMLLCLPEASVPSLLALMLGQAPQAGQALDAMQLSAIKELGNILCSAYLNAMSRFLDMQLLPSVPALAVDMVSSILSAVLSESAEAHPQALLIETRFSAASAPVSIHLFMIPEQGALNTMLESLAKVTGLDPSA